MTDKEMTERWGIVFNDMENKTHIVKKPTRLCCTPMAPRCDECEPFGGLRCGCCGRRPKPEEKIVKGFLASPWCPECEKGAEIDRDAKDRPDGPDTQ